MTTDYETRQSLKALFLTLATMTPPMLAILYVVNYV